MKKTTLFMLALLASTHLMQAAADTGEPFTATINAHNLGKNFPGISFVIHGIGPDIRFKIDPKLKEATINNTGTTTLTLINGASYYISVKNQNLVTWFAGELNSYNFTAEKSKPIISLSGNKNDINQVTVLAQKLPAK